MGHIRACSRGAAEKRLVKQTTTRKLEIRDIGDPNDIKDTTPGVGTAAKGLTLTRARCHLPLDMDRRISIIWRHGLHSRKKPAKKATYGELRNDKLGSCIREMYYRQKNRLENSPSTDIRQQMHKFREAKQISYDLSGDQNHISQ